MNPSPGCATSTSTSGCGGYARHLWRRARARRASTGRATCCSLFATTTSRCGRRADDAHGRRARGGVVRGYPRLAREFRDADGRPPRHSFFFPGEQYAPHYLERAGDAGARRLRRGRAAPAPRRRHRRKLRADIADYLRQVRRARPPVARQRRAAALRVHPRQLVPGQRAPRRPLVRRRRRDPAPVRHRLLRRLHVSRRRPTSRSRTSSTRSTGRRAISARRAPTRRASARASARRKRDRILMIEGPLALARRRELGVTHRERRRARPAIRRRPSAVRNWVGAGDPRRGAAGVGLRQGAHARRAREERRACCSATARRAMHARSRGLQRRRALAAALRHGARDVQHRAARRWTAAPAIPTPYRDYALPPPPVGHARMKPATRRRACRRRGGRGPPRGARPTRCARSRWGCGAGRASRCAPASACADWRSG